MYSKADVANSAVAAKQIKVLWVSAVIGTSAL
jgi:hypothetical protein